MDQATPIDRLTFAIEDLVRDHPPRWADRNKRIVHEIASPDGLRLSGQVDYSRWSAMTPSGSVDPKAALGRVVDRPGFFDYAPVPETPGAVEWHVNFADPYLFVAYRGGLFAQDEMQVSEHPVLGSVKEALEAKGLATLTATDRGPTPVLIMGAPRLCEVATEPNAAEGRPRGLYGNAFSRAEVDAIRRATRRIDPPALTNLIAIAAPSHGQGRYSRRDIEGVLTTAYTGLRAAVLESRRMKGDSVPVVVHTGFWGCGAFGGNRTLMTTLQTFAAELAGLDRLVFHTGDPSGAESIEAMRRTIRDTLDRGSPIEVNELIGRVESLGLEWGVSDGN